MTKKLLTPTSSFNNALSFYREQSAVSTLHRDVVRRFVELQCLLLAVIAPHWAEGIWLEILEKPESIQLARFPTLPDVDTALSAARRYISQTASSINSAEGVQLKKKAKGKEGSFDPKKHKKLTIYMSENFPAWQAAQVELLRELWDPVTKSVDDKVLISRIDKADKKRAVPFVQALKKRLLAGETERTVFDRKLPFEEKGVLVSMMETLKRSANLTEIQVVNVQNGGIQGVDIITGETAGEILPVAQSAVPGNPTFFFTNVM